VSTLLGTREVPLDLRAHLGGIGERHELVRAEQGRQRIATIEELERFAGGQLERARVDEVWLRIEARHVVGRVQIQIDARRAEHAHHLVDVERTSFFGHQAAEQRVIPAGTPEPQVHVRDAGEHAPAIEIRRTGEADVAAEAFAFLGSERQRPVPRRIARDGQVDRVGGARLRQPLEEPVFLNGIEPVVVRGHVFPVGQDAVVLDEPEGAGDVQPFERVDRPGAERRLRQREDEVGLPLVRHRDDGVGQHRREAALQRRARRFRHVEAAERVMAVSEDGAVEQAGLGAKCRAGGVRRSRHLERPAINRSDDQNARPPPRDAHRRPRRHQRGEIDARGEARGVRDDDVGAGPHRGKRHDILQRRGQRDGNTRQQLAQIAHTHRRGQAGGVGLDDSLHVDTALQQRLGEIAAAEAGDDDPVRPTLGCRATGLLPGVAAAVERTAVAHNDRIGGGGDGGRPPVRQGGDGGHGGGRVRRHRCERVEVPVKGVGHIRAIAIERPTPMPAHRPPHRSTTRFCTRNAAILAVLDDEHWWMGKRGATKLVRGAPCEVRSAVQGAECGAGAVQNRAGRRASHAPRTPHLAQAPRRGATPFPLSPPQWSGVPLPRQ
jgi:hypothetical protein